MVKKFFLKLADLLGFHCSTKYVQEYLHKANIRSGTFMAAIVAILEMWLVIRQHQKYIIAQVQGGTNYFESLFNNTSLFWLLMIMGISMFFYCLFYLSEKKSKTMLWVTIGFSILGFVLCCLLPNENRIKNYNPARFVDTVLLIALYVSIALFHISVVIASFFKYKGKTYDWLNSVLIITLFALVLLIFGIKVSYGDFSSTVKVDGAYVTNPDYKQIICFLMMTMYVGCLLIWRPYISIGILGAIFLGFYFLLKSVDPNIRKFPDGDEVNYITFFISLAMVSVSIFNQRNIEARKDEELELLATKDKLTGLLAFEYFTTLCSKKIKNEDIEPNTYIYLFFDITSFKVYNDQKGFEEGNIFLKKVGQIITEEMPGALISRPSDDHFVVFIYKEGVKDMIHTISERVKQLDADIRPGVIAGAYILKDVNENPHSSIEKARYACAALKKRGGGLEYLRYDSKMQEQYNQIQYIVSHIDEAVEKGWIVPYYQPVVFSKDHTLCGVEALARWIDPNYGFMNPGLFIGALEDAQLAHKVDLAILEIVCKNMRRVLDNNETVVPTSINFSRADFSVIDVPSEIDRITKKYNIPREYLHIEITESALLEEHADLIDATLRLKQLHFAIWLDDFGSGYSSFNTLKDYSFDVLKLDMEFLKGFATNQKSKPLIKAVIDLANQIGMRTLAEGVETEEQAEFLKSINCERLQGYLFSKPITYEELNKGIAEKKFVISKNL